jgi:hypothetical protein
MVWLGALWHLFGGLTGTGPAGLLAGTAAAPGVLLVAVLAAAAVSPPATVRG